MIVYIHSPYVLNVATTNNRIRIPSRKLLGQHAVAAAAIGAKGLIVHGGHVNAGDDPAVGIDNWRKTFARQADEGGFPLPILIENTAGGNNAMARRFDRLAMLWDAVGEFGAGFCLDTCHAYAGGEDLVGIVERVLAITGRIDLVHANNSRDTFDSGRRPARQLRRRADRPAGDRRGLPPGRQRRPRRDARGTGRPGRRHRLSAERLTT